MIALRNISKICSGLAVAGTMGWAIACTPETNDQELGPMPTASFTVTPITGKTNTYLLSNTTPGAFITSWDKAAGKMEKGALTDTAYFESKGTYAIKMQAFTSGGSAQAEQTVTVANDDPEGCFGAKALLSGCNSKTWVLDPAAGALWVGPNDGGGAWWSNGAADVTDAARTCLFNDEYTFKKDGTFSFDDKGDMRVDDEANAAWPTNIGLAIGCYSITQIPNAYQAWGSGTHSFKIVGNNKLQVIGKGAHLGSYKLGEAGNAIAPEEMVTYDIMSITATKLVIKKQYGWGQWRYTFSAK